MCARSLSRDGTRSARAVQGATVTGVAREREDAQRSAGLAGNPQDLRDALQRIRDLGADEVNLVPTSGDPDEVDRAADAIASL